MLFVVISYEFVENRLDGTGASPTISRTGTATVMRQAEEVKNTFHSSFQKRSNTSRLRLLRMILADVKGYLKAHVAEPVEVLHPQSVLVLPRRIQL